MLSEWSSSRVKRAIGSLETCLYTFIQPSRPLDLSTFDPELTLTGQLVTE